MSTQTVRNSEAVSMRFRPHDLALIDRGAAMAGLSRTEFMTKAALHEAQMAVLNARMISLSPNAWGEFEKIMAAPAQPSPKMQERLARKAPWAGE